MAMEYPPKHTVFNLMERRPQVICQEDFKPGMLDHIQTLLKAYSIVSTDNLIPLCKPGKGMRLRKTKPCRRTPEHNEFLKLRHVLKV
jgi:hypothetical protein